MWIKKIQKFLKLLNTLQKRLNIYEANTRQRPILTYMFSILKVGEKHESNEV